MIPLTPDSVSGRIACLPGLPDERTRGQWPTLPTRVKPILGKV
jgi:hypothetical protein